MECDLPKRWFTVPPDRIIGIRDDLLQGIQASCKLAGERCYYIKICHKVIEYWLDMNLALDTTTVCVIKVGAREISTNHLEIPKFFKELLCQARISYEDLKRIYSLKSQFDSGIGQIRI